MYDAMSVSLFSSAEPMSLAQTLSKGSSINGMVFYDQVAETDADRLDWIGPPSWISSESRAISCKTVSKIRFEQPRSFCFWLKQSVRLSFASQRSLSALRRQRIFCARLSSKNSSAPPSFFCALHCLLLVVDRGSSSDASASIKRIE